MLIFHSYVTNYQTVPPLFAFRSTDQIRDRSELFHVAEFLEWQAYGRKGLDFVFWFGPNRDDSVDRNITKMVGVCGNEVEIYRFAGEYKIGAGPQKQAH